MMMMMRMWNEDDDDKAMQLHRSQLDERETEKSVNNQERKQRKAVGRLINSNQSLGLKHISAIINYLSNISMSSLLVLESNSEPLLSDKQYQKEPLKAKKSET